MTLHWTVRYIPICGKEMEQIKKDHEATFPLAERRDGLYAPGPQWCKPCEEMASRWRKGQDRPG